MNSHLHFCGASGFPSSAQPRCFLIASLAPPPATVPATTSNSMGSRLLRELEHREVVGQRFRATARWLRRAASVHRTARALLVAQLRLRSSSRRDPDQVECRRRRRARSGTAAASTSPPSPSRARPSSASTAADLTPGLVGVGERAARADGAVEAAPLQIPPAAGPTGRALARRRRRSRWRRSRARWSCTPSRTASTWTSSTSALRRAVRRRDGCVRHARPAELRAALADAAKGGARRPTRGKLTTMNASVPSWQKRLLPTLKYSPS